MIDLKLSDLLLKSVSCLIFLLVCSCQDPVQDEQNVRHYDVFG